MVSNPAICGRIRLGLLLGLTALACHSPVAAEAPKKREIQLGGKAEIKRKITLTPQTLAPDNACQVGITIAYQQMNDVARVRATLVNDVCIASHGELAFRVRTRTADGESRTRTFDETWQRTTAGAIEMTKFYPMDGDTDLIWVRTSRSAKTGCLCTKEGITEEATMEEGTTDESATDPSP